MHLPTPLDYPMSTPRSADYLWRIVGLLLLAAIAVALLLLAGRADADTMPAPLVKLLDRLDSPGTPQWKRDLVPAIRQRQIRRTTARATYYCPGNSIDPLGGGLWGAWGVRLRKGHAAVGTTSRLAPYGSVLYCPGALDHLLVIVDCGPGVNGRDRIDVCLPDAEEYLAADPLNWTRHTCWVLGRVGKREAR